MGCCVAIQEAEMQIKRGDMLKYSIMLPNDSNGEWVLTNQDSLRTMKITKAGVPREAKGESGGKVTKLDFHMEANNPGQEILLFAKYNNGTKNAKAIKKVKVKVL
eukprot:TRINITY_DN13939_c0_g1_i2.p3 TRINITY_DN13939_c0_g1~~TRINITY_DN13939_c0_g1_i2.p3  ORF type:complete len:105 (-),score=26.87 TRINITY_DN13939_c0_g1_i2:86-400(-)